MKKTINKALALTIATALLFGSAAVNALAATNPGTPSVSISAQSGPLTPGTAGTATFTVTAIGFQEAPSFDWISWSDTLSTTPPAGITVDTVPAFTAGGSPGNYVTTITMHTTAAVSAKDYNFTAYIGSDWNAAAFLRVGPANSGGETTVTAGTLSFDANGAASGKVPPPATYVAGASVSIPGNTGSLAKAGFVFGGWNTIADGSGATYRAGTSFEMRGFDVTLYAAWIKAEVTYDPARWPAGVGLYNVAYLASDKTIVPTSYYDPAVRAVIYKTPVAGTYAAKYNSHAFGDIAGHIWSCQYIWFLSARNIVDGTGDYYYTPDGIATRAEFVKILACMTPGIDYGKLPSADFSDVPQGKWYARYIDWAAANKIDTGSKDGFFRPEEPVTLAEMSAMIAAYATSQGYTLGAFPASVSDGSYDVSAPVLALAQVLQSGAASEPGALSQATASRTQAAAVACKLLMGILAVLDNPSSIPVN